MTERAEAGSPPLESSTPASSPPGSSTPASPGKRARGVRRAGLALALGLLVLVGATLARPETRTRLWAHWVARGLDSPDPMKRTLARQALLDLGRPAIDPVYARLVAGEVADEVTGVEDAVVIVGHGDRRTVPWPFPHERSYEVEEVLLAPAGNENRVAVGCSVRTDADPVCPTAQRMVESGARRELVVYAPRRHQGVYLGDALSDRRVAVPLDDDLAPEILEAVRARLAHTP